jgi:hypothetical protein
MFRNVTTFALVGCVFAVSAADVAFAQVGEPQGSFLITVRQGGGIVAQDTVTIGPGMELDDLKATFQDGDPEDFTQIGTIGPGNDPIILKVTSDGGPSEPFRILHWYIDVPVSLGDIYTPGPTSLFSPVGGDIDVTVSSLEFANGVLAQPLLVDNDTYLTSFMRDWQGHFYESTHTNAYNYSGFGVRDIQVPGEFYLDGTVPMYSFAATAGTSSSWVWDNIENPGLATTVHNGFNTGVNPLIPGYVFELGLSVAFVEVPEPATLTMLAPFILMAARRRRKR